MTLEAETIEKAKKYGLNVSQISNEALKEIVNVLDQRTEFKNMKGSFLSPGSLPQTKKVEPPAGFEPATFSLQALTAFDWAAYRQRIHLKGFNMRWESTIFSNSKKFGHCLLENDFSAIRDLPETTRPNVLKSLSFFSKDIGRFDEFNKLRRQFGIRWTGKSSNRLFIERFQKEENTDELFKWVIQVKTKRPGLDLFLDLMVSTGLRLVEAVHCWNLLVQKGLTNYYNESRSGLEHYKQEGFLRPHKSAFFSYAHKSLPESIANHDPYSRQVLNGADYVLGLVKRSGLHTRFADLRELHGTFMLKWLKPEEIDFLQGRVSSSVFMRNYYNPSLMDGLRERALNGIDEILELTK